MENTRQLRKRRSSILKWPEPDTSEQTEAQNKVVEDGPRFSRRKSKRVSFAGQKQVIEIATVSEIDKNWKDSISSEEGLSRLSDIGNLSTVLPNKKMSSNENASISKVEKSTGNLLKAVNSVPGFSFFDNSKLGYDGDIEDITENKENSFKETESCSAKDFLRSYTLTKPKVTSTPVYPDVNPPPYREVIKTMEQCQPVTVKNIPSDQHSSVASICKDPDVGEVINPDLMSQTSLFSGISNLADTTNNLSVPVGYFSQTSPDDGGDDDMDFTCAHVLRHHAQEGLKNVGDESVTAEQCDTVTEEKRTLMSDQVASTHDHTCIGDLEMDLTCAVTMSDPFFGNASDGSPQKTEAVASTSEMGNENRDLKHQNLFSSPGDEHTRFEFTDMDFTCAIRKSDYGMSLDAENEALTSIALGPEGLADDVFMATLSKEPLARKEEVPGTANSCETEDENMDFTCMTTRLHQNSDSTVKSDDASGCEEYRDVQNHKTTCEMKDSKTESYSSVGQCPEVHNQNTKDEMPDTKITDCVVSDGKKCEVQSDKLMNSSFTENLVSTDGGDGPSSGRIEGLVLDNTENKEDQITGMDFTCVVEKSQVILHHENFPQDKGCAMSTEPTNPLAGTSDSQNPVSKIANTMLHDDGIGEIETTAIPTTSDEKGVVQNQGLSDKATADGKQQTNEGIMVSEEQCCQHDIVRADTDGIKSDVQASTKNISTFEECFSQIMDESTESQNAQNEKITLADIFETTGISAPQAPWDRDALACSLVCAQFPSTFAKAFEAKFWLPNEHEVLESFLKKLENQMSITESAADVLIKELSNTNLPLLQLTHAEFEGNVELQDKLKQLASNCKAMGNILWKKDKEKFYKGLNKALEGFVADCHQKLYKKFKSTEKVLELAEKEFAEETEALHRDEIKRSEYPTAEQERKVKDLDHKLAMLNQEIAELKAKSETSKNCKEEMLHAQKNLSKLCEKQFNSVEAKNKLRQQQDAIKKSKWVFEVEEGSVLKFSFINNTVTLRAAFMESLCPWNWENRVKSYSLDYCLTEEIPKSEENLYTTLHQWWRNTLSVAILNERYPDLRALKSLLRSLSSLEKSSTTLLQTHKWIAARLVCKLSAFPQDSKLVVSFLPPRLCTDGFQISFSFEQLCCGTNELDEILDNGMNPTSYCYVPGKRQQLQPDQIDRLISVACKDKISIQAIVGALLQYIDYPNKMFSKV